MSKELKTATPAISRRTKPPTSPPNSRPASIEISEPLAQFLSRRDLSWRAKAMALTITAHPELFTDGTVLNKVGILAAMGPDSEGVIYKVLSELERSGLLTRINIRNQEPGARKHVVGSVWQLELARKPPIIRRRLPG